MIITQRNIAFTLLVALFSFMLFSTHTFAAGSDSKEESSPDQKKQEKLQKATSHYNAGVEHMKTAREKAAQDDSTFAFNYRATSDAKAKREYEKAVSEFKKAINYEPTMAEAHNNLGYCYRKLGELEQSLKHYMRALKLDDSFAQAREYLGETYLAMGEMDKAKEQHNWLVENESIYADTLAQSIKLYKLKEVDAKLQKVKGE
jgi:tetratricopeptide (TPR) repeat protein